MSLYRRGEVWWMKFKFHGSTVRESTGFTNKEAARKVEITRKNELLNSTNGITEKKRIPLFSVAAEEWLKAKKSDWEPKTHVGQRISVAHLSGSFKNRLLSDIDAADVLEYKADRLDEEAAPKTVSDEIATLRSILRHYDLDGQWSQIRKRVKLAKAAKVGRCISKDEEDALLRACQTSRSRSLYPAVVISLNAGLRYSEIRLLQWRNIDLLRKTITVGESKTDAGEGRVVPMNMLVHKTLSAWALNFPQRKLNEYMFPSEKYGQPKNGSPAVVYAIDVTAPIGSWKEAFKHARKRALVSLRFHDLRHTAITRWLDSGVDHMTVSELAGWSASTTVRMMKEVYGHIGLNAKQSAITRAEEYRTRQEEGAQKWAQPEIEESATIQ